MEFQELLMKRRSMRFYDETKEVTKEQLEEMIKAAAQAPSWKNTQTARYHCIINKELLEKFRAECLPEFNQKNSKGATLVVAAFVKDHSGFNTEVGKPSNECGNGWGYYDLGLHNELFLLKAKELGLDTLIMGIRDADKIRKMLNIPEEEIIVSVIAVGYAAKEPGKPTKKTVEELAKFY